MDQIQWRPWYRKIIDTLGYDISEDERAAVILNQLLKGRNITLDEIKLRIKDQPTLIFGAGPSLEADINRIAKTNLLDICRLITADGATTGLLKIAMKTPDIIVSDLDGRFEDLQEANNNGAFLVIHAHGDNIQELNKYVKELKNILGTTQVEPIGELYNFGGFTDGDRAVILAEVLNGKPLALVGMDLGEETGIFSKEHVPSPEVKKVKLRFCKDILEWQAANTTVNMYNLTGSGENIKGITRITPETFENIILNNNH